MKNQKIAYFLEDGVFCDTDLLYNGNVYKNPFTFAMNVITPVVLTALGIIMLKLAECERAKRIWKIKGLKCQRRNIMENPDN